MDPFALLALPKRPLLSEEEIGQAYRRLAGELHPDQAGGDASRFKELSEAAAILRDPARRLRSLADVIGGSQLPSKAAELFPEIATLLREADSLIGKHHAASNPLAKAVLAAPMKKLAADLESLLGIVHGWRSSLDARLAELDASWPAHETEAVASLADSFAYATRWESQLRERKLSLDCL
ncbi:MAG: DnaJ domain [Verrucomicrobiota bacterium]|jgi:curved DNA-binding protein CbpA